VAEDRVDDVERVVVDKGALLLEVHDHPASRARNLPERRRCSSDEDHEHAGADRVLGEVLLGDQVLALAGLAVDDRDPPRLGPGSHPAREAACHTHEVGVVEILVAVAVPPSPPDSEAAWRVPDREVGIEHDPIHAVVAPLEQILIPVAEVITHAATVDPHSPVVSSCPKGPRSRACLGSGVDLLDPRNS
jgi:hypothetical protein